MIDIISELQFHSPDCEVHSEPCQTSKMGRFEKIVNGKTIFSKQYILDVWQGSEYGTEVQRVIILIFKPNVRFYSSKEESKDLAAPQK